MDRQLVQPFIAIATNILLLMLVVTVCMSRMALFH